MEITGDEVFTPGMEERKNALFAELGRLKDRLSPEVPGLPLKTYDQGPVPNGIIKAKDDFMPIFRMLNSNGDYFTGIKRTLRTEEVNYPYTRELKKGNFNLPTAEATLLLIITQKSHDKKSKLNSTPEEIKGAMVRAHELLIEGQPGTSENKTVLKKWIENLCNDVGADPSRVHKLAILTKSMGQKLDSEEPLANAISAINYLISEKTEKSEVENTTPGMRNIFLEQEIVSQLFPERPSGESLNPDENDRTVLLVKIILATMVYIKEHPEKADKVTPYNLYDLATFLTRLVWNKGRRLGESRLKEFCDSYAL